MDSPSVFVESQTTLSHEVDWLISDGEIRRL
jgi:hypothetical protein